MEYLLKIAPQLLLLLFLIITFLQSGIDKVVDWKGNLAWLKEHFAGTPLKKLVPWMLGTILFTETASGLLCSLGIISLILYRNSDLALFGAILSCLSLLMLLFGQRMARDYEGAKTIAVYFIPAVFLVYLLSNWEGIA